MFDDVEILLYTEISCLSAILHTRTREKQTKHNHNKSKKKSKK